MILNNNSRTVRILFAWSALLLMNVPAHAAINACTTTEPTEVALTGYNGSGNGCASVDMSFQNFTVNGGAASGSWVSPTLANTGAYASGLLSGDTASATMNLNPTGTGNWTGNTGNNTSLAVSTFTYVATAQTGGSYTGGSYSTPATPGYAWVFDAIRLLPNVSINNSSTSNTATVTLTICLNATSTVGCAANLGGTITALFSGTAAVSYTASCTNVSVLCSNGSNLFDFVGNFNTVAITTTIQAARGSGSNAGTVAINNIGAQFDTLAVAPEPSTFGLLGFALAGLGVYARRRR